MLPLITFVVGMCGGYFLRVLVRKDHTKTLKNIGTKQQVDRYSSPYAGRYKALEPYDHP